MISLRQWRQIYPEAPVPQIAVTAVRAGVLLERFAIAANRRRLAFFLAQIGHESSGLKIRQENLNYSAARLMQVWPSRFRTLAAAQPYADNPAALANLVYGGRMGNVEPGDGYHYRGRGYIQLTGREAYREVGRRTGLKLEQEPERALEVRHALHVACGFWDWKDLNLLCDTGDFIAVTRRINGGTVGLEDRQAWLARVRAVLGPDAGDVPAPVTVVRR